ncbi:MAG: phage/plasmid primase, P4 family [Ruminococcus sp.]
MHFTLYTADCRENARNIRYPNPAAITSAADLKKATAYDHVCAQYADGIRKEANFQFSDVLPMDCDNDHSDSPEEWITPQFLADNLCDVAFAVTYSRHHMLAKGNQSARPRFHVFFPTIPCNDANSHKAIKQKIHKELPFFDGNALDAARFLFGCPSDVFWHEGSLSIEDWLTLMKSNRSIPQGQRNSTMSRMAAKLVKRFGVTEESYQKFLEKSAECEPPLPDEELETIWNSACKFGKKVAKQEGYVAPEAYGKQSLIPDDFSDVGEARTFVEQYADEVAFTVATDYLRYNGTYWEESEHAVTLAMMEHTDVQLAEAEKQVEAALQTLEHLGIPREAAKTGGKKFRDSLDEAQTAAYQQYQYYSTFQAFVMKYRNVRNMTNALDAAKPIVLHNPEALDSNPMLLNTPGGTYYLPEGLNGWKPTDPVDLLTKVTAVVPSDTGKDLWEDALQLFFCGDQSLIDYVQMICGLCIVGKVYLEAMIIAYGDGRNGKSTFWNVIYKVLGSYSGNISADALTVNCKRNVKPEMAELKGKRMILAAELQEGMRLNTSVVKQLCSTDPIFAEKKFKAPFHFEPSHTLVLYTNHLPKVGASDDGTWRRLIVIPFHAKIQGSKDIKNYTQHLVDNAGGAVLSWLIEGARKVIAANYQITRPQCVLDAIGSYREGNDWLGNFINECCIVNKSYQEKSGELYNNYREYCIENGEYIRSTSDFYAALEQAGYKRKKMRDGKYIIGIQLTYGILD